MIVDPGGGTPQKTKKVIKMVGGQRRVVEVPVEASSDPGKQMTGRAAEVAAIIKAGGNLGKSSGDKAASINAAVQRAIGMTDTDKYQHYSASSPGASSAANQTIQDILKKATNGQAGKTVPATGAGSTGDPVSDILKQVYTVTPASVDTKINNSDMLKQLAAALSNGQLGGNLQYKAPSDAELEATAAKAVNPQYDAQIKAIQDAEAYMGQKANKSGKDMAAMYDQLMALYDTESKKQAKGWANTKATNKKRGKDAKDAITSDYTGRLKEQVALYKQLGIQAAVPGATGGQYADEAGLLAQADQNQNVESAALAQQSQADRQYMREGKLSTGAEKLDQIAGIMGKLQDYDMSQQNAITQLKGSKASAYAQAVQKLKENAAASLQAAQEQAGKAQDSMWAKLMDLANYKEKIGQDAFGNQMSVNDLNAKLAQQAQQGNLDLAKLNQQFRESNSSNALNILKAQISQSKGNKDTTPTKGLEGAAAYLGDTKSVSNFQQALDAAVGAKGSADMIKQFGHVPSSPEEIASLVRAQGANMGLTPAEQAKLYQAALIYFGKGK